MKNTTNSRVAYNSCDAAEQAGSLYLLPLLAAARYRELKAGHRPRVITKAGPKITALQEIEAGVFEFQKYRSK
jgi:DNA-directed RNA polymerase subunit K/omega